MQAYLTPSAVLGYLEPVERTPSTHPGWRRLQCTHIPDEYVALIPPAVAQDYEVLLQYEQREIESHTPDYDHIAYYRGLKERVIKHCLKLRRNLYPLNSQEKHAFPVPKDFRVQQLHRWANARNSTDIHARFPKKHPNRPQQASPANTPPPPPPAPESNHVHWAAPEIERPSSPTSVASSESSVTADGRDGGSEYATYGGDTVPSASRKPTQPITEKNLRFHELPRQPKTPSPKRKAPRTPSPGVLYSPPSKPKKLVFEGPSPGKDSTFSAATGLSASSAASKETVVLGMLQYLVAPESPYFVQGVTP
ncbi:hypothetical protein M422DRAFT_31568 [Sphaerobolus stellatus SS14]|uniref:Uncharacterized protein n=1 Tax=Sphaerobolus stellatus (strain SS14) TaxID=990650 RepID=A0A0C9UG21_SPHS4|nr:hypothetical protein M422DRAFT_31568 [Sphaerobolus stellatus SS14]